MLPTRFAAVFITSLCATFGAARAQTAPDTSSDIVIEALPKEHLLVVGRRAAFMVQEGWEGDGAKRGVYTARNVWPRLEAINVCFFGGDAQQRRQVIDAAMEWTKIGARIPLSFGTDTSAADCRGNSKSEHIRVGFRAGATAWSAIGTDSVTGMFKLDQPSMNLGYAKTMNAKAVKRLIMHEFGHALGLQHEHQNPRGKCWREEYDLKVVDDYLRGRYGWDGNTIEANMKLIEVQGTLAEAFDAKSIMIYGFPDFFYKAGRNSRCFAEEVPVISGSDAELMRKLYPVGAERAAVLLSDRKKFWASKAAELPANKRGAADGVFGGDFAATIAKMIDPF